MPDGGTITIATGLIRIDVPGAIEPVVVPPGLYVRLVVWDTGIGLDQETREHIFEPGFTTKAIGKGTSLGLATSYEIVQQAGGHIWVYSEPGIGSSFTLLFPFVEVLKALAPGPW
jgi:signal transduction histidine kinase